MKENIKNLIMSLYMNNNINNNDKVCILSVI